MVRVFTNVSWDRCLIPGLVIPKTQKMVLYASLLDTQLYNVRIKAKWINPGKEVVAMEKGAFDSTSTKVGQLNLRIHVDW